MLLNRRALAFGASGLAGILGAGAAKADTAFTSFSFLASGASTARTDPARWSDVKNVLDYGADPTGTNDCTAAIQAAISALSINVPGTGKVTRGTIFFPAGTYLVTGTVNLQPGGTACAINFRGVGLGSWIQGGTNGYIFDTGNSGGTGEHFVPQAQHHFYDLQITNSFVPTSPRTFNVGAIRMCATLDSSVENCYISGYIGINLVDSQGQSVGTGLIKNCEINGGYNASLTQPTSGSTGIYTGSTISIISCDIIFWDTGVVMTGAGALMFGCRCENANTGVLVGTYNTYPMGNYCQAGCIIGMEMESVGIGVYCLTTTQCFFSDITVLLHNNTWPAGPPGVTGFYLYPDRTGYNTFVSCIVGGTGNGTGYAFDVSSQGASGRLYNTFIGCSNGANGIIVPWHYGPSACCGEFINCEGLSPVFTYANLPSRAADTNIGDQYNISDCNTSSWGVTAGGGGSTEALVRWNGSSWTVVGI